MKKNLVGGNDVLTTSLEALSLKMCTAADLESYQIPHTAAAAAAASVKSRKFLQRRSKDTSHHLRKDSWIGIYFRVAISFPHTMFGINSFLIELNGLQQERNKLCDGKVLN